MNIVVAWYMYINVNMSLRTKCMEWEKKGAILINTFPESDLNGYVNLLENVCLLSFQQ